MTYEVRHLGAISIEPPLTYREISDGPDLTDLTLVLHEPVEHTDAGYTVTVTAVGVHPRTETMNGYMVREDLEALAAAHGDTHTFVGYFEMMGADGEQWRLFVRGRTVIRVEPVIVWRDVPQVEVPKVP